MKLFGNAFGVRNHGGGATPFGTGANGVRTNVAFMPMKSLTEMRPYERLEAIKTSRFILNRLGLGRALVEGCSRYAVGEGIFRYSSTGDPDFDAAADKFLDGFMESVKLDVREELNAYEMQESICPEMMTGGDAGAAKILERDDNGKIIGLPQIQLFQSDQIGNGGSSYGSDESWEQGILRNAVGKALKFRVLKDQKNDRRNGRDYWEYKATDFMHILDPKRINQGRGIPWLHHGHNSCLTMLDLTELEHKAAYINSYFSGVITTPTGEAPEGFEKTVAERRRQKTQKNAAGQLETVTDIRKYAEFLGGAGMLVLKDGEKWEPVKNERPSLTFTGFMDWLVNDIAWGFGVPPSYVWAIVGRNGPETRMTLNQADWFFRFIMRRMISRFCKPLADWILLYGLVTGRLNNGRMPRNGADYRLCRWRGPKKLTIDERYFYKTWLDRLAAGKGTEEEFYAEQGKDWEAEQKQRVKEISHLMQLCKDAGIPYQMVVASQPGQDLGSNGVGNAGEAAKNIINLAQRHPDFYEFVAGAADRIDDDPDYFERLKAA